MELSPKFYPLFPFTTTAGGQDYGKWSKAQQLYIAGKYRQSLQKLFSFLDPSLDSETGDNWRIPHGSVVLHIALKDETLYVEAPFLKITGMATALMRQASELNFHTLLLSQIVMRGDELHFVFSSPLDLCEPKKIFTVLTEISVYADFFDDIFIDEMGASRIENPDVRRFAENDLQQLRKIFRELLEDALASVQYYERKRQYQQAYDLGILSMLQIDFHIRPQGKIRTEIESIVSPPEEDVLEEIRVHKLRQVFLYLAELSDQQLEASLYLPHFLISIRRPIQIAALQQILREDYNRSLHASLEQDFPTVVINLFTALYFIFFRYILPGSVEDIFVSILKKAAAKPWEKSAQILLQGIKKILSLSDADASGGV